MATGERDAAIVVARIAQQLRFADERQGSEQADGENRDGELLHDDLQRSREIS